MVEFVEDRGEDAYERVVDRLLASPRYGEHWAQHWLDVVRYADTHGFEVNTERPNAWPYRDYVIRAFNANTPYDRFVIEQIAGDAMQPDADAGTGFLVTASVLLPGQIGKDAPSIRLARQDSLDEMVNNIGQTFLALSIGCARCHDHKFDPVTQKDYYAMQAFVAGVEYEDRVLRGDDAAARRKSAAPLLQRVRAIDARLAQFVPIARPGSRTRETNAARNVESFSPIDAKFVRFTIHDSNLHPKLGLIEPCIDEFEIFTGGRNVARQARVTASGSRVSASHKLEHINDGLYGNASSWMSGTKGTGWVMFELPEISRIEQVIWSRDRQGKFTDRLPVAYTLEAGLSDGHLCTLAESAPLRPAIGATPASVDRFAPVRTKLLRFSILNTNSLEPCFDEIEVFDIHGENVALASRGTRVKTSGDTLIPDRHDPSFINDGEYGNERSWLGNERAKGWVELEFPAEAEITRVVWSRDREGKLLDRLPIEYRIEVRQGGAWTIVADSTDRRPHIAGTSQGPAFTVAGLTAADAAAANRLLAEKSEIESTLKTLESGQKAFAGTFRAPDDIHVLNRGDPEQPKEAVQPAIPASLGSLKLDSSQPEQDRRRALASWIASPENPLTARVMINRIWQGHFGAGLVETPSDFGRSGMKPSHPELLDCLASEFIRSGWNIKHMHRLIVLSETYRQESRSASTTLLEKALAVDSEDRLLWHFPSRRLDSEVIHDSMLAISGTLNFQMYGRGFDLFDKRGGLSGFKPVETFTDRNQRRMIYAHKVRRERETVFGAFDCPDAGQSTARRRESTTPIQALNLLNSQFTLVHADAFVTRVTKEAGTDIRAQVCRAYELALNRQPTEDELRDAEQATVAYGLSVLCRALFNSNEFLFQP